MYKINKIKNYKEFARFLEEKTKCSIKIQVVSNNHMHYQLNDKYDMTLGVLCIDDGEVSFAPFATLDNAKNEQYINVTYMVQFDEFSNLLKAFQQMFVVTEDNRGEN